MIKYIQYVLSMVLIALARGDNNKIKTVIIDIPSGQLKGLESISKPTGKTVYEFRGIPFAKPPVDKLRFKKPVPFGNWHETLDATVFGAGCPQYIPDHLHNIRPSKMSEDCLVLNVYVPMKIEANRKLSVMMWIHGGAFILGHAHQYDGGGWLRKETLLLSQ